MSSSNVPLSRVIIIALIIFLPIIGFFLGMEYQKKVYYGMTYQKIGVREGQRQKLPLLQKERLSKAKTQKKIKPYKIQKHCSEYGPSPNKDFLIPYEVKQGDTLLSIAKSQLGNSSRYNEIIVLNEDQFPHFSIHDSYEDIINPYLEQGWILYLPPDFIQGIHRRLNKINGEIAEISEKEQWRIVYPGYMTYITPTSRTLVPEGVQFKVGDCVSVIYESDRGIVYSASLQN